jgi:hypothetical protein
MSTNLLISIVRILHIVRFLAIISFLAAIAAIAVFFLALFGAFPLSWFLNGVVIIASLTQKIRPQ